MFVHTTVLCLSLVKYTHTNLHIRILKKKYFMFVLCFQKIKVVKQLGSNDGARTNPLPSFLSPHTNPLPSFCHKWEGICLGVEKKQEGICPWFSHDTSSIAHWKSIKQSWVCLPGHSWHVFDTIESIGVTRLLNGAHSLFLNIYKCL